jgi:hypothetical protein
MNQHSSHWLSNPRKETLAIIMPLFIPVLLVYLFQDYFSTHTEVNTIWWIVLVLVIDVGHVYSTVFRFYWEKDTFQKYKTHLVVIPTLAFISGILIHYYDSFLFWRLLAYGALYHFIRQQYGFMRLYARKESQSTVSRSIDSLAIYNATIYPVIYWHQHLTETLSWFVPNDFIAFDPIFAEGLFQYIYLVILGTYLAKEIYYSLAQKQINLPKNGIVLGTYLSWYAGIVFFHGDLAFTLMNVVSHGIPYMALIWIYGEKKKSQKFETGFKGVLIFILVLIVFAYFEETLWDVLVWKDHPHVFPFFESTNLLSNPWILSLIVPLLTLPQITHYVIDGFIWRFSKDTLTSRG